MPLSFSLVAVYSRFIRRCFTGAGLCSQALNVDDQTTMHFWGPRDKTAQKPSLLLLHGFGPEATWQWRQQVQFLAPHFNVYVPDLIFFGGSTTKSSERSQVFQAACVGKLMDKLEVERFHVAGTSYGGMVAYNLAQMLGKEKVQKVVIASSGVNMTKANNVALLHKAQLDKIEDLMAPTTPQNMRKLMSLCIHKPPPMLPHFLLRDFLHKLYAENRKEKLELLEGLTIGRDDTSNVSPLQQEVLILWGEQDKIFPVQLAHELKEVISEKARLELIKDTSHVPQMEKPEEFNKILLSFLQEESS
ncbi:monoacylglycerol lipase ABHD6 [Cajanus cajan]|uniref:Monoacylglycerol lipase ABHD6 n=1 Tax=Cajanus cajan TaxID=3821 RepID=A0A151RSU1_CAJCA|nr:monoacylglycerol lipase ABHD6 [Cajanus cajan]KYP45620.1 Monoacylglycerol lipase ABHD6 [Cajanus cajan]